MSLLTQLFPPQPITGYAINGWIRYTDSFFLLVYAVAAVTAVGAAAFFLKKRHPVGEAIRRGLTISFFAAGFVYLAHGEITWTRWLVSDLREYGPLNTPGKISRLYSDGLLPFTSRVRAYLGPDPYTLYAQDTFTELLLQYYLLPSREKKDSPSIVVWGDREARFDIASDTLTRRGKTVSNVELVYFSDPTAYMVRKK